MWLNKPNATYVPPCMINDLALSDSANCKASDRLKGEMACARVQVAHASRRRIAGRGEAGKEVGLA